MPERTLRSIQQALNRSNEAQVTQFLLGIALLALTLVLVALLVRKIRGHRRLLAEWKELAARGLRLGLTREERTLLRELAKREAPWTPLDVVQNIEVFERAVHGYLEGSAGPSGPRTSSAAPGAGCVRSVRVKLGFERPPGLRYFSTRELEPGQEVRLKLQPGGPSAEQALRATGRREDYLELTGLAPVGEALRGRRVDGLFFRGSHAYGFQSEVVGIDLATATCLLRHTIKVTSGGLREFQRVALGKPAVFRAEWEGPDVRREGTVRDVSGGGLSLQCPCYYETGERLVLAITPGLWLRGGEGDGPAPENEQMADRQMAGVIVDTEKTGDGRCIHHVEFRDATDEDRQYVMRLVRRIELSAAREAATEPVGEQASAGRAED